MKNMKLIMESWRGFVSEQEEDETATGNIASSVSQAYKAGPGAVRAFMDSPEGKDPKVRQFLHRAAEEYDGDASDDVISISRVNAPLNSLVPTQKYIDLMQSVSFPLGSADTLKKAISSKKGHGPISISDNYILDGHHRWSGQFAITPDGTILGTNIALPGPANNRLAALQLAIAAIDPGLSDEHPSKGGGAKTNILGLDDNAIYEKILANRNVQTDKKAPGALLNDKMIAQIVKTQDPVIFGWAGIPDGTSDSEQVVQAIAKRVAANLAELPMFAEGSPDRPDMPQLDHDSIGGDKGYKKIKSRLATGRLNVVPPFAKAAE